MRDWPYRVVSWVRARVLRSHCRNCGRRLLRREPNWPEFAHLQSLEVLCPARDYAEVFSGFPVELRVYGTHLGDSMREFNRFPTWLDRVYRLEE